MEARPIPPQQPPRPTQRRRRIAARGWVSIAVAVAALAGAALVSAAHQAGGWRDLAARAAGRALSVAQPTNVGPVTPVQPQEPFSVLVMGVESAPAYAGPELTDSMMVMSYDPQAGSASLLSVPRDLWVDVPGFGQNRVNTALEDGGPATAELTVEKALGVPIEYYAVVNYQAFVNLVNTLGGVDVVVPSGLTGHGIYDPTYPNPNEDASTLFVLGAGPQHLDGATALEFIRERHSFANEDLQREADQQQVLLSLKQEILQPQNLVRVPSLLSSLFQSVTTNVPYADLPVLANEVLQLPQSSIATTVFAAPQISDWTTPGNADVLLPNPPQFQQAVQQTFPGLLGAMGALTVQVENGAATTQDLATYFTGVLQGMGVTTLAPETAAQTDYKDNQVYINTAVTGSQRGQVVPTEAYILGQMLGTPVQDFGFPASQAQLVVILGAAFPSIQDPS